MKLKIIGYYLDNQLEIMIKRTDTRGKKMT